MSVGSDLPVGAELLGFRIERVLGRGGMGVVYLAEDRRLKRKVALKLLAPRLAEDERLRERLLFESELAASLDHPNIVPIYEAGEADGRIFMSMRYVEGQDLKRRLRDGPLDQATALSIVSQVASALDAAHARGLVHRDVKPSNVLIAPAARHEGADHVYLADFGLSRRLAEQAPGLEATFSLGTPAYVAPEQIQGDDVDERADVYSLGCLLYECLTGGPPYPRESELAVLWAHLNDPPPSPPGLDDVMAKALAKEPSERYATCGELVDAARNALGLSTPRRDRRPLVIAAVAVLVAAGALAAGLALALANGSPTTPKADLTVRRNSLVRIDPETNAIAAVIKVGRNPQAVAVAGRTVWVYNKADQTVSAVDARTNAVRQTSGVSAASPTFIANPIAADAGGAWVVGTAGGRGVVTRIRADVAYQPQYFFDESPAAVAVGAGAVWIEAQGPLGDAVLRLDPTTGAVLAKVPIGRANNGSSEPSGIAVGEGYVWTTTIDHLVRIDPKTNRVTGSVNVGEYAGPPVVRSGAVWVVGSSASSSGSRLVRVDPRTMRITNKIAPPGRDAWDLALLDGSAWWNGFTSGTVSRIDINALGRARTTRVTPPRTEGVAVRFHPFAITAGAGSVWVTISEGSL